MTEKKGIKIISKVLKKMWPFQYGDSINKKLEGYAKAVWDQYTYSVKEKSDICLLLCTVDKWKKLAETHYEEKRSLEYSLRRVNDRHGEELASKDKDIKRFELEVIHLKELVQEKNMVIDKMIQKKE